MKDAERIKYQRALGVAIDALNMYAAEESYHAIAVMIDRPAGAFADDFALVKGSEYRRPMPGKTARKALQKLTKSFGSLTFRSTSQ